ncbi:hypothetical protein [Sedimenticola hydrogenitrophicus]|uniref:hypothetical protein n=1 Tax=Sedimenticola hydrogenitrophicus TaxID=2967975 RepID=UPI0021A7DF61|nr:hypothetical protein [Sedimenticola hydrogenitrophicus]
MDNLKDDDGIVGEILRHFARLEPRLSKKITHSIPKRIRGTKCSRIEKVHMIYEQYPDVFRRIAKIVFFSDEEMNGPLGYSSNSLVNSIYKLTKKEPVSGSFGSRYSYGQGEIE